MEEKYNTKLEKCDLAQVIYEATCLASNQETKIIT